MKVTTATDHGRRRIVAENIGGQVAIMAATPTGCCALVLEVDQVLQLAERLAALGTLAGEWVTAEAERRELLARAGVPS